MLTYLLWELFASCEFRSLTQAAMSFVLTTGGSSSCTFTAKTADLRRKWVNAIEIAKWAVTSHTTFTNTAHRQNGPDQNGSQMS